MEGQYLEGRIAWYPSLPVLSWATRSVHLPHITLLGAETWILLTLTGGDHYNKGEKNIKEIAHPSFERLKPGHNSVHSSTLAVLSVGQEPTPRLAAGQCSEGTFAAGWQQNCTMKSPMQGVETQFPCPAFCHSFCITHGMCRLTSQCLVPSIWKVGSDNIYLPQEVLRGLTCLLACVWGAVMISEQVTQWESKGFCLGYQRVLQMCSLNRSSWK